MKKIITIIVVFTFILVLVSCKNGTENMNHTIEEYRNFFDQDIEHKPSEESASRITKGMSYRKVDKLLGKPHSMDSYTEQYLKEDRDSEKYYIRKTVVIWYLDNGNTLSLYIDTPSSTDSKYENLSYTELIYKFGTVSEVHIIEHVELKESEIPILSNPVKYFDNELEHKPSVEDVEKIVVGMTLCDAYRILGLPHSPGGRSGFLDLIWYFGDGCYIQITPNVTTDYRLADKETKENDCFIAEKSCVSQLTVGYNIFNDSND